VDENRAEMDTARRSTGRPTIGEAPLVELDPEAGSALRVVPSAGHPTVRLDQSLDDGETQSRRPGRAVACRIRLIEPLEQVWHVGRIDTGARVMDTHADPTTGRARLDRDRSSFGTVADRVVDECAEDLSKAVDISDDDEIGRCIMVEPDPGGLGARGEGLGDIVDEPADCDWSKAQRQVAGLGEADRSEVVDDPREQA
jgi:hypothetical protein